MNYNTEKNNKVFIMGEVVSEANLFARGVRRMFLRSERARDAPFGAADVLPVTVSERLISDGELKSARRSALWDSSARIIRSKTENRA